MGADFLRQYFGESARVARELDVGTVDRMVLRLVRLRDEKGRLFLCGVGGSAANCSHAVNDFRKLAGIESYTPTDNVSELTARTNDEGWDRVFADWLRVSHPSSKDVILVLSVGGGSRERNISVNIVEVIDEAKNVMLLNVLTRLVTLRRGWSILARHRPPLRLGCGRPVGETWSNGRRRSIRCTWVLI